MKKRVIIFLFLFYCSYFIYGQDNSETTNMETIPFTYLFHDIGWNLLHSFTHNYGMNYALSGLGTYYMVHSGADWEWRNIAAENDVLPYLGLPFGLLGFALPVALPLGMYIYGHYSAKADYQIVGLALGQAAIFGWTISSTMKAFTGRQEPEISIGSSGSTKDTKDFSDDFAFGFMERGIFHGWPSSHTMVMTAMAITLSELYPYNIPLKVAAYSYSILTGIGMSLFTHWASDSVAGFLIGISIGKSVGSSFRGLLESRRESNNTFQANGSKNNLPGFSITENLSLYILPNTVGINICF